MSLPATIAPAIQDTVIARLAPLFLTGANGDVAAARGAAAQMLAAHKPETPDELSLAADIISLQLHTLEALSYAATPDLSLSKIFRLRGSAVSLSRESFKAQRRLDQLQKARREGIPAETQLESAQPEPKIERAIDLIEDTRTVTAAAKTKGLTWTQAYEQRQRDIRIAASLKRAEARVAAQANAAALSAAQTV
jgi:hypothetical protein